MKQVQVIWSNAALSDLEGIYDFLADHSQRAAQTTIEKIFLRTRQIEDFPDSGAAQPTLRISEKKYRYLVEGPYKIIYTVIERQAYIATIFDTRSDPEKLKL